MSRSPSLTWMRPSTSTPPPSAGGSPTMHRPTLASKHPRLTARSAVSVPARTSRPVGRSSRPPPRGAGPSLSSTRAGTGSAYGAKPRQYLDASLFDRPANRAQMLSEREVAARLSRREVLVEAGLAPEAGAELHARRLRAFRVTDVGCHLRNIAGAIQRHKQDAVVVSHDEVVGRDDVLAASGGRESKRVLRIKALWTGGQAAPAGNKQTEWYN